jgi:hypothetical protein
METLNQQNMPDSKDNMMVHGLSVTLPGLGTFHIRGGQNLSKKDLCQTFSARFGKADQFKERFADCSKYAKAAAN